MSILIRFALVLVNVKVYNYGICMCVKFEAPSLCSELIFHPVIEIIPPGSEKSRVETGSPLPGAFVSCHFSAWVQPRGDISVCGDRL